jgi:MFS family permease
LFIGAAVAGAGVGAGNLGAYRTLTALVPAHHRAGMVAAIFTIGYLALSVPVLIAGVGTTHFGLHRTALVYYAALAALSAAAATSFIVRRPQPANSPEPRTAETHRGEVSVAGAVASDIVAVPTHPRRKTHEGPLRVLVGTQRFSENHAWSEMPKHWPSGLAARAVIAASRRLGDALTAYLNLQPPAGLVIQN